MGQPTERLFRINDEISALRRDEYRAFEELIMLGHLDDDARRDAAVSGGLLNAADARATAGDVARMERHVFALRHPHPTTGVGLSDDSIADRVVSKHLICSTAEGSGRFPRMLARRQIQSRSAVPRFPRTVGQPHDGTGTLADADGVGT